MRFVLSCTALAFLTLGGIGLMGCDSADRDQPAPTGATGVSGGNGAFGENPQNPGSYQTHASLDNSGVAR